VPQFSIYRNRNPQTKSVFPLLLDIQSDLLEDLPTRAVIPLTQSSGVALKPLSRLTPVIKVDGKAYILLTYQLAGIAKTMLGPVVSDASDDRDVIVAALDFLIGGV
jgi:toxin CcdB